MLRIGVEPICHDFQSRALTLMLPEQTYNNGQLKQLPSPIAVIDGYIKLLVGSGRN